MTHPRRRCRFPGGEDTPPAVPASGLRHDQARCRLARPGTTSREGGNETMSPVFRHGRLRLYLLKLLDEAPRHGYEVIRLLQDRFMGIYARSPGTIYPRLARLEEEGLVTHDETDGRKVYRITEKGREELRARLDDLDELEEEITASVRDIAREVTEDVRETVRTLREELSWAAREFHARAHQTGAGGDARHARTDEARARAAAARTREAAARDQAERATGAAAWEAAERETVAREQAGQAAQAAAAQAAGDDAAEGAPGDQDQARSGPRREDAGREREDAGRDREDAGREREDAGREREDAGREREDTG